MDCRDRLRPLLSLVAHATTARAALGEDAVSPGEMTEGALRLLSDARAHRTASNAADFDAALAAAVFWLGFQPGCRETAAAAVSTLGRTCRILRDVQSESRFFDTLDRLLDAAKAGDISRERRGLLRLHQDLLELGFPEAEPDAALAERLEDYRDKVRAAVSAFDTHRGERNPPPISTSTPAAGRLTAALLWAAPIAGTVLLFFAYRTILAHLAARL